MSTSQHEAAVAMRDQRRGPWILVDPSDVPEDWRGRGTPLVMLPLLQDEADSILAGRPATPAVDDEELRLLQMVARAPTIRQIAKEMGLGERATQKRLAALRRQFGVGSTSELSALLASKGY